MEHTTFEQAVAIVQSLPSEDRERFGEWFKDQEQLDKTASSQTMPSVLEQREARFRRALRWLEENKDRKSVV